MLECLAGLEIEISAPRSNYITRQAVILTVTLTNGTANPVRRLEGHPFSFYKFDLQMRDGSPVPLTRIGVGEQTAAIEGGWGPVMEDLGRYSSATFWLKLSVVFDMTRTGDYVLEASRKLNEPATKRPVVLRSNRLQLHVSRAVAWGRLKGDEEVPAR